MRLAGFRFGAALGLAASLDLAPVAFGAPEEESSAAPDAAAGVEEVVRVAMELASERRFAPAESVLAQGLAGSPREPGLLYYHAVVLSWDGRYDDSIREYRRLLELQPANVGLHAEIARVLTWQAGAEQRPAGLAGALAEYDALLAHQPDHAGALEQSAALCLQLRRAPEALARLDRLGESAAHDPNVARLVAEAWTMRRRHDRALAALELGLRGDPGSIDLRWSIAELHVRRGRISAAADQYRRILDRDPTHEGAHRELARILTWEGRPKEAAEHLAAVMRFGSDSAEAIAGEAELAARAGDWRRAERLLGRARSLAPGSASIRAQWRDARWESRPEWSARYERLATAVGLEHELAGTSLLVSQIGPAAIELGAARTEFHERGRAPIRRTDGFGSLEVRVASGIEIGGTLTRSRYARDASAASSWTVSIAARRSPRARVFLSAGRSLVTESMATLKPDYRSDHLAAGAAVRPTRTLALDASARFARHHGTFARGYWNSFHEQWVVFDQIVDASRHRFLDAQVAWEPRGVPSPAIGYRFHGQEARDAEKVPYWAPFSHVRHEAFIRFEHRRGGVLLGAEGLAQSVGSGKYGWGSTAWCAMRAGHVELRASARHVRTEVSVPWNGTAFEAGLRVRP